MRSTTLWMARKTRRRSPWGYHFRRNVLQWGQGCDQPCWCWVFDSTNVCDKWQHQGSWHHQGGEGGEGRQQGGVVDQWFLKNPDGEILANIFWYYLYWPNDKNWDPKPITKILVQNYFLKSISPSIDARFQHWSDTSWCQQPPWSPPPWCPCRPQGCRPQTHMTLMLLQMSKL